MDKRIQIAAAASDLRAAHEPGNVSYVLAWIRGEAGLSLEEIVQEAKEQIKQKREREDEDFARSVELVKFYLNKRSPTPKF